MASSRRMYYLLIAKRVQEKLNYFDNVFQQAGWKVKEWASDLLVILTIRHQKPKAGLANFDKLKVNIFQHPNIFAKTPRPSNLFIWCRALHP